MSRKKAPAQLDREIAASLQNADLQRLVDQWKEAASFNYRSAQSASDDDGDDSEYRHGYAAAMERASSDLRSLIQRKA